LYNAKFKFEQWVFVIARTSVIDFSRMESRKNKKIEKFIYEMEDDYIEEKIQNSENMDYLNQLDEKQKTLLELKYVDQLSYLEISKVLNKSEASLRKMVSRLVVKIRNGDV
jgi:RNA polymerase sigma-70 factor (ECF subfamily)